MKWAIEPLATSKDFGELDSFADTVPNASIFQTGRMARVYSQSPDTKPLVLAARSASGEIGASVAGVTFTHVKRASPISQLSSHFTVRGAPLASSGQESLEATRMILQELPNLLSANSVYIRCYPDLEAPTIASLERCGYVREDWLNIVIDLEKGERQLLEGMSKHRRKGIRVAANAGFDVIRVSNTEHLDQLYRLLADTHRRLRIPFQRRPLFDAAFRDLSSTGNGLMLLAMRADEVLAGRIVLLYRGTAYDWYAGSTPRGKQLHADEWLTWNAMLLAKERDAVRFDFGGAGKPDEEYGPREFKRRFGGRMTNAGRYTRVLARIRFVIADLAQAVLRRI